MNKRFLTTIGFFLALVIIWQGLYLSQVWSKVILPSPLQVGEYFLETLGDGVLENATLITIKRLLVGYIIGLILGIPLGMLNARFEFFEDTLGVIALSLQALPSICWAPLALLWFGQTESAMLFIVIMGSLWSIVLATDTGMRHVPPIYVKAAKTLGSKGLHTWFYVRLPASLPFIVSGMKQGWAFSWRSLMAAEVYITILSGLGLGQLLHYNRELNSMEGVFAIMFVIILIGLAMDKLVFTPLETFLSRRFGFGKVN